MKLLTIIPLLTLSTLSTAWRLEVGQKYHTSFTGDRDRRCTNIDDRLHRKFTWDGDEGTRRRNRDEDCCVTLWDDKDCRGRKRNAEEFCGNRKYTGETKDQFYAFSVDCFEKRRNGDRDRDGRRDGDRDRDGRRDEVESVI